MVKKVWVLIALVAGVVLGFFLTTFGAYVLGFSTAEADGWASRVTLEKRESPLTVSRAATSSVPQVATSPGPVVVSASARVNPSEPGAARPAATVAYVVGDVIDPVTGKHEYVDPLLEEFLREERDDSWAYMREAELESSMATELGAGDFNKERIECRASICLVELSATGGQVAKLGDWIELKNKHRSFSLDEPLMMRGTSFRGDGSTGQARILYMNPRRVMSPPKRD